MHKIDLTEYAPSDKAKSLGEKDRGVEAREYFKLDQLDKENGTITVIFPKYTYSVTTSFFCGLFGESYKKLGEKNMFLQKYKLDATESMWLTINDAFERLSSRFKNRILVDH